MTDKAIAFRGMFASLLVLTPTMAVADGLNALVGHYGFNWLQDPNKAKCMPINENMVRTFGAKPYVCDLTPFKNTASGESAVKCSKNDNRVEYLIFDTKAGCDKERETQAANGD